MKKCGFYENSDFLQIYVGINYIKDLSHDISLAFNIGVEALYDSVIIKKTPIIEDADIKNIKRYVGRWVKDKEN